MHLPLNHAPITRDLCANSLIFLNYKRMHLLLEMIAWKSPVSKVQSPGGQCVAGGTWGPAPLHQPVLLGQSKLFENKQMFLFLALVFIDADFFFLHFALLWSISSSAHVLSKLPVLSEAVS